MDYWIKHGFFFGHIVYYYTKSFWEQIFSFKQYAYNSESKASYLGKGELQKFYLS